MARILAKSINCESGPTLTPCGTCHQCRHITAGQSVDVVEIDAASNTGVDHMRQLNDQVHFLPVECRNKIYIIDEAHMLSSGAFNALLKTLEEPPKNVIFILATTEPQKLPITIHSRCQLLPFRKVSVDLISRHLTEIAAQESIPIDTEALGYLARNADGCMRDAISLLEQVWAFSVGDVTVGDVMQVMGAQDTASMLQLVQAMVAGNMATVATSIQMAFDEGLNPSQFMADLVRILQQGIRIKLGLDPADIHPQFRTGLTEWMNEIQIDTLLKWAEKIARFEVEWGKLAHPDIAAQILLLSLTVFQYSPAPRPTPVSAPSVARETQPESPPELRAPSPEATASQPNPVGVIDTQSIPEIVAESVQPIEPDLTPTIEAAADEVSESSKSTHKPVPSVDLASVSGDQLQKIWAEILIALKAERRSLVPILIDAIPIGIANDCLEIQWPAHAIGQDFFGAKLKDPATVALMNQIASTVIGRDTEIRVIPTEISATIGTQPLVGSAGNVGGKPTMSLNDIIKLFEGTLVTPAD